MNSRIGATDGSPWRAGDTSVSAIADAGIDIWSPRCRALANSLFAPRWCASLSSKKPMRIPASMTVSPIRYEVAQGFRVRMRPSRIQSNSQERPLRAGAPPFHAVSSGNDTLVRLQTRDAHRFNWNGHLVLLANFGAAPALLYFSHICRQWHFLAPSVKRTRVHRRIPESLCSVACSVVWQ